MHYVIFDSNHRDDSDLIDLKLSPRQAYRLAMNLLHACARSVETDKDNDYIVIESFTGRVVKSRP